MKQQTINAKRTGGFTLMEVLVAAAIFFAFTTIAFRVYFDAILQARAGMSQMVYMSDARMSQQQVTRLIERSKIAQVSAGELFLYVPNPTHGVLEMGELFFDGGYSQHQDNQLTYRFRSMAGVTTETVIVNHVGPIESEPFFSMQGRTVQVSYRVGDPLDDPRPHESGPGYQGVNVQFDVTPRNLQLWFD